MGGHRLVLALGLALTCTVAGLAQPVSGPAASPALLPAPKAGAPASFAFATSPLQNPAPLVAGGKAVLAALRKGGYIVTFDMAKRGMTR